MFLDRLLALGILPDSIIRIGIRRLLRKRIATLPIDAGPATDEYKQIFYAEASISPIAIHTQTANEQHYEVPTSYFEAVLGPHLKYSCGYWESAANLEQSEASMLALTCERAELEDGQTILELGCGWGSLSLWMAKRYPNSQILAVSNSQTQRTYIETQARKRRLTNLTVQTCDMNVFSTELRFDRVVSVEMMEHMRNHHALLQRITGWLKPSGKIFVHIFTHRQVPYVYEAENETDWMAKYFFAGGMMPSADLFSQLPDVVTVTRQWTVPGTHYQKTCEAWLVKHDAEKTRLWPLFEQAYGKEQARRWWNYWRIFYMACAELFTFNEGQEWFVSHYLLEPIRAASPD